MTRLRRLSPTIRRTFHGRVVRHLVYTTTAFQCLLQPRVAHAESFSALRERHTNAAQLDVQGGSLVTGLRDRSGPSAVGRPVIAIYVESIQRVAWRAPHVAKESREASSPTATHGNATTPVARIVGTLRIRTATDHLLPFAVLWRPTRPRRKTVAIEPRSGDFIVETPATPRVATAQVSRGDVYAFSAFADTPPHRSATDWLRPRNCNQSPETLTGKIDRGRHGAESTQSRDGARGCRSSLETKSTTTDTTEAP